VTSTLDPLEYRRVVGRFATGVTVVTTVLAGGERHAMTCNSFTSVSLDPVLVLFCAEKIARFHDAVLETGRWAVSVLGIEQREVSRHFSHRGRDLGTQFDHIEVVPGEKTGAPVLRGAVAVLECHTVSTTDAGDHTVLIGEVLTATSASLDEADPGPLLYYAGGYRTVGNVL
jgi:flavin reductase (DIM6/NTAB) family NADH-FMN oxidoreductase RutF